MGTLLMITLQVNLQHPCLKDGMNFGNAGRLVSAEFNRQLATVDGKIITVPNLAQLMLYTDKAVFQVTVEEYSSKG
jgi:hypothetical protein